MLDDGQKAKGRTTMKMIAITGLVMGACLAASVAVAGDGAIAADNVPSKVTTVCQTCHGPRGDSPSANIPRLNAQHAEYITARLKSFLDPGREDPHATAAMWGVASTVDDATLAAIANYYAAQTPTPPGIGGPLAAEGKKIYANGNAADNIPACQSCHGPHAEGNGVVPRLAGQHGDYLKKQLERLRFDLRASNTMHPNVNNITDRQIEALVAYLAKN